jgi:hypothetical protein
MACPRGAVALFAIVSVVTANWDEAAKAACKKWNPDSKAVLGSIVVFKQCKVKCVAKELPSFQNLEDGTVCRLPRLSGGMGVCSSGRYID